MEFKDALRRIVERVEGSVACMLMGREGLAIETFRKDGEHFDIDSLGVELTVVLGCLDQASDNCEVGSAREILVRTEKVIALIHMLSPEYFILLALDPRGNVGKGRYAMRVASAALTSEVV